MDNVLHLKKLEKKTPQCLTYLAFFQTVALDTAYFIFTSDTIWWCLEAQSSTTVNLTNTTRYTALYMLLRVSKALQNIITLTGIGCTLNNILSYK